MTAGMSQGRPTALEDGRSKKDQSSRTIRGSLALPRLDFGFLAYRTRRENHVLFFAIWFVTAGTAVQDRNIGHLLHIIVPFTFTPAPSWASLKSRHTSPSPPASTPCSSLLGYSHPYAPSPLSATLTFLMPHSPSPGS